MEKYKTINENNAIINPNSNFSKKIIKENIFKIDRFTPLKNGEMLEDLDGEYILFEDVLKLLSNS